MLREHYLLDMSHSTDYSKAPKCCSPAYFHALRRRRRKDAVLHVLGWHGRNEAQHTTYLIANGVPLSWDKKDRGPALSVEGQGLALCPCPRGNRHNATQAHWWVSLTAN